MKITKSNENKKHSKEIMIVSLIKYLAVLFILVLCTYGIFIYPLIFVWLLTLFFSGYYIKLWKYQGYSILLLISISLSVIAASLLISPIIRQFLLTALKSSWGGIILTVIAVALTVYTIRSKQDDKEASEMAREGKGKGNKNDLLRNVYNKNK